MTVKSLKIPTEEVTQEEYVVHSLKDRLSKELVIGLVGPVGSGCSSTYEEFKNILETEYGYKTHYYKLSDFISENAWRVSTEALDTGEREREDKTAYLQEVGKKLREKYGGNYLAALAIEEIHKFRLREGMQEAPGGEKFAKVLKDVYFIDSLKHEEELILLKEVYGDLFWLVGVFAAENVRKSRLTNIKHYKPAQTDAIIQRDIKESGVFGQNVRDVFPNSDFFIRNDMQTRELLKKSVRRFIEIVFQTKIHTPTIDETSMYAAYAASMKSACLSRKVGAAIITNDGEQIATGRNDVPCFNGGLYSEESVEDNRCYAWNGTCCHNDDKKRELCLNVFSEMGKAGLLSGIASKENVYKALMETNLKSLIEYSRAVHAEMDAITSVARNNKVGIKGASLYVTTFPCHNCARHIVACGIKKVFFIEPYPKSLAEELHSDSVSQDENDGNGKVLFLQYSGIAPKTFLKIFGATINRKDKEGKLNLLPSKTAAPVVSVPLDDLPKREETILSELFRNEKRD